jgi:hypothetical protein
MVLLADALLDTVFVADIVDDRDIVRDVVGVTGIVGRRFTVCVVVGLRDTVGENVVVRREDDDDDWVLCMLLVAEAVDSTESERRCFADTLTEVDAVDVGVPEYVAESVKERVPLCDPIEVRDPTLVVVDVLVFSEFLVGAPCFVCVYDRVGVGEVDRDRDPEPD